VGGAPVAGRLTAASGIAAGLSLIGYGLSGQPVSAVLQHGAQKVVDKIGKMVTGPLGEKVKDTVTSDVQTRLEGNRCA
jgi:hypothetical protein